MLVADNSRISNRVVSGNLTEKVMRQTPCVLMRGHQACRLEQRGQGFRANIPGRATPTAAPTLSTLCTTKARYEYDNVISRSNTQVQRLHLTITAWVLGFFGAGLSSSVFISGLCNLHRMLENGWIYGMNNDKGGVRGR